MVQIYLKKKNGTSKKSLEYIKTNLVDLLTIGNNSFKDDFNQLDKL